MVGTGDRGCRMWGKFLLEQHGSYVNLAALCDINSKRAKYAKKYIGIECPTYKADEFEKMIRDIKPDAVIVTTTDCYHASYIIRALEMGCNVITEKPIATTSEQCQDILDTEKRTGKKIFTTFNARHDKTAEEIKKILLSGELGRIISVDYQEYLDVYHGAQYFRRWHGKIRFSGSLLVHKACHHFDQMNWWLDSEPEEVQAFGKVAFYGKNNPFRYIKCRECPHTKKCDFYWDIGQEEFYMNLYVACEDEDGYYRDGCVWDNKIDTYDSMTVEVKYKNDVIMSYALNAFMPYEGQQIAFNGEKGRLEVRNYLEQPWEVDVVSELRLTKSFHGTRTWTIEKQEGEHGGADMKLKDLLFIPDHPDPLNTKATSRDGVMASLIGIGARESIQSGKRVKIKDLIEIPD